MKGAISDEDELYHYVKTTGVLSASIHDTWKSIGVTDPIEVKAWMDTKSSLDDVAFFKSLNINSGTEALAFIKKTGKTAYGIEQIYNSLDKKYRNKDEILGWHELFKKYKGIGVPEVKLVSLECGISVKEYDEFAKPKIVWINPYTFQTIKPFIDKHGKDKFLEIYKKAADSKRKVNWKSVMLDYENSLKK